ncbi:MAG: hypothetical protein ACKO14_15130 [Armatimonadota bacterium]
MNASFIRWRDQFAANPLFLSTQNDGFSVNGVSVAKTFNPDVLAFSISTELPIWLENLPTSLKLASELQREHMGVKVLYVDDPENDGLYIRLAHECYLTGMEDISLSFIAIVHALRCAFNDFCEQHTTM